MSTHILKLLSFSLPPPDHTIHSRHSTHLLEVWGFPGVQLLIAYFREGVQCTKYFASKGEGEFCFCIHHSINVTSLV